MQLGSIFERELASLVALQVLSSKGEEEENFLTSFNKPRLEALKRQLGLLYPGGPVRGGRGAAGRSAKPRGPSPGGRG